MLKYGWSKTSRALRRAQDMKVLTDYFVGGRDWSTVYDQILWWQIAERRLRSRIRIYGHGQGMRRDDVTESYWGRNVV